MPNVRSRLFVFTWNNYPLDHANTLDGVGARYHCYGKETAPETGTPHLQGALYFQHAKTVTAVRRLLPGLHVESAKGTFQQNKNYCSKDGLFYESGDPPISDDERGSSEAERWDLARIAAKSGNLDSVPSDIFIRYYSALRAISKDYMEPVPSLTELPGLWITGKSGSGKSRACYDQLPGAYWKPRNLWWDGYQREEVVVIDDFDRFDVRLGGKLKHWGDRYPFIAEVKGGATRIRPRRVIVTSQYTIEEIWEDAETRDALLRRFKVVIKVLGQDIIL